MKSPDFRRDPISGRTVVIAPARARRPGAGRGELEPPTQEELDECPFEEGREDRTPSESFAIAPPGRETDTPGWRVRVVPNLYPALERQEVVIHSPVHVQSLAELDDVDLGPIAAAWRARREAARTEGFEYVHVLVNEGQKAGASLPHSHSQLAWLRGPPPAVVEELPNLQQGRCALCELLQDEKLDIALQGDLSLRAAPAGRAPYELLVAPRAHQAHPDEDELAGALLLLRSAIVRIREIEGPMSLNIWLHEGAHWHFELLPRLTVFAGLELGAGIYVNWLPPEEAASLLRAG